MAEPVGREVTQYNTGLPLHTYTDGQKERAARLEMLARLEVELFSILNPGLLLGEAVRATKEIFSSSEVALAQVEGERIVHRADSSHLATEWASSLFSGSEWEKIIRLAKEAENPFPRNETHEEMLVPLKIRDRLLGVMAVRSEKPGFWTEEERALLYLFASQVSLALENVELLKMALAQGNLLKKRADRMSQVLITSQHLLRHSTNLDRLLEEIADLVQSSLDFELVAAAILDERGRVIRVHVCGEGEGREELLSAIWDLESLRPFMQNRYRMGRCYFVPGRERLSLAAMPGQPGRWQKGDIFFAPIEGSNLQMLGLLMVDRPRDGKVPTAETALALELFASQASLALDHARLFQELERRLQEVSALFMVGRSLVTSLNLDEVLTQIVDAALKTIAPAQKVVIHLLDKDGQQLISRAVSHHGTEPIPSAQMRVGRGIAGYAVAKKRAIYVPDTASDTRFVDIGTNIRSLLVVPLILADSVIGTLSVDSTKVDAFDPNDKRLLTMLANYAAIAIENARLYAEAKRADELAIMNKISTAMTATLELDQVLRAAMEGIGEALAVEGGLLVLVDERSGELISRMGLRHGQLREETFRFAPGQGIAGWVVRERRPLLVADVRGESRFFSGVNEFLDLKVRSVLCVPLSVREEVIGAIEVVNRLEGRFTEDDLNLLSSIAASVAIAIENARLYTRIKSYAEELARSHAQLVQSAKLAATGKLAASIAHEINNPLQAVQSCIYLVADGLGSEDPNRQYLDIARDELGRIATILRSMIDFYRPSKEGRKPTDINEVLQSVLTLMSKRIQQSQVTLKTTFAPELPCVTAISDHLKQVFFNIILNAIEAMPEGGELYVNTSLVSSKADLALLDQEEDFIQVEFRDTGVGIAPEAMDNIFDPFYTTKTKGSGLGLSISYDIIEQHGGRIEFESKLGQGTTFTIKLPVETAG